MSDRLPVPPGYTDLVPLEKEQLQGKARPASGLAAFARELNSIFITAPEFFQAAKHYPVAFGKDQRSGSYLPLAIVGLNEADNLFVDDNGDWEVGNYIPAWVRRWPFFAVQVSNEPASEPQSLIAVDPSGLVDADKPYMDAQEKPSAEWEQIQKLIQDFEGAREQTVLLCKQLQELDLLEPFTARAMRREGGDLQLGGMYRVSEEKLNALPDKTIKQMMKKGRLSRIYAHMMSLDNFQRLLDIASAKGRPGNTETPTTQN
ncbi:MAG: SapC family protein [Gammaproteobacteria bacterium]|nr:SapC family protein [Gammaproteobacteria bacterium]